MRNDLYAGALISIGLHCGLALIDRSVVLIKSPPPLVDDDTVIQVVQRPEELMEPPTEPADEKLVAEQPVARPELPDLPRQFNPTDFQAQLQRPVPEAPKFNRGMITIPSGSRGIGSAGSDVFTVSELERPPLARFQARPEYPFEMRRAGIAGEVLVEFIVDAHGAVREARAVSSSQREFEAAAVQAVSKWTFRPGQKGGRNVATRMQVPIVFTLNEGRE